MIQEVQKNCDSPIILKEQQEIKNYPQLYVLTCISWLLDAEVETLLIKYRSETQAT